MTDRRREIEDVDPERRHYWLAAEIDGLELSMTKALTANTEAVRDNTTEVKAHRTVMTGLLVSIIIALIGVTAAAVWLH